MKVHAMRAGERTRTVDTQLGKLVLYQLSYARARPSLPARKFAQAMVTSGAR
jgi:hypothetical protein